MGGLYRKENWSVENWACSGLELRVCPGHGWGGGEGTRCPAAGYQRRLATEYRDGAEHSHGGERFGRRNMLLRHDELARPVLPPFPIQLVWV